MADYKPKRRDMLPFWTDAYLADTTHLDTIHHGAYFLLLMKAWRMSGAENPPRVPDDDLFLRNTVGVTQAVWRNIKPYVMEFWKLEDGFWTQKKLTEAWENDEAFRQIQRDRRAAAEAQKRAEAANSSENEKIQAGSHPEKTQQKQQKRATIAEAEAEEHITNVICDTENEKPPPKKRRKRKPALPLPDDWKPKPLSPEDKKELELTPKEVSYEFKQFKNHAEANDRRQANWQAAWRNWLYSPHGTYGRRLAGKGGQNSHGSSSSGNGSQAAGLGGSFEREIAALTPQGEDESIIDITPNARRTDTEFRLGFDEDTE